MAVKICGVEKKSPAAKKRIKAGDTLLKINGNEIVDVLDYRFYLTDPSLTIELTRNDSPFTVEIKKGEYDDPEDCDTLSASCA